MIKVDDIDNLPKEPDILLELIRNIIFEHAKLSNEVKENSTISEENKKLSEENEKLLKENSWLREIIEARNRRLFGRKSEKLGYNELQAWLFNEAEIGSMEESVPDEHVEKKKAKNKRSRRGRKPISDKLPRKVIEHDLSESEKTCTCCSKEYPRLKPEITEDLDYIPGKVIVNQHVYFKYGPCDCDESKKLNLDPVKTALREKKVIPGSIAAPSLLAFIATSKFSDALPFYRLEKMFSRIGVDYKRATMCNQMTGLSRALGPLLDLMWKDLLSGDVIRMDETRLQVIDEPGREADQISWMHVASGDYKTKKILLFHYHMSRKSEIPKNILRGWKGYLQTDGLAAYNLGGSQPGIIHVGCWAHARRKFIDARGGPKAPPGGLSDTALGYIKRIFEIEETLRDVKLSNEEFVKRWRKAVEPLLDSLKTWLSENIPRVAPKTLLY